MQLKRQLTNGSEGRIVIADGNQIFEDFGVTEESQPHEQIDLRLDRPPVGTNSFSSGFLEDIETTFTKRGTFFSAAFVMNYNCRAERFTSSNRYLTAIEAVLNHD